MPCLDTTFFIDLAGRSGRARMLAAQAYGRRLRDEGLVGVTTRFNVAELYVGVELSADPAGQRRIVDELIENIEILEFDEGAAMQYARIEARLPRTGRPVGTMDELIAAVALSNGQTIATRNIRHFADIPGLIIEAY